MAEHMLSHNSAMPINIFKLEIPSVTLGSPNSAQCLMRSLTYNAHTNKEALGANLNVTLGVIG
jgi:hypothetical protein